MWSPSSLIFLVLLGVWAAYFLQYWIRRRDHLATARSVEQFSEAMRVLQQRDRTPRTDLSEPAPRSWNVHPARPARPQVLVKRAVPAEPAAPVVTERVEAPVTTASSGPVRTAGAAERTEAPARTAPAADRRREPRPAPPRALPARVRPSRRVRAVLMLVALVELAVIGVLVPLGQLPVWALAPGIVALVLSFAYMRAGVRAERALRAARRRRAHAARRQDTASPSPGAEARGRDARPAPPRRTERGPRARPAADPARSAPDSADAGTESGAEVSADAHAGGATSAGPSALHTTSEPRTDAGSRPDAAAGAEEPAAEAAPTLEYVHLVDEDDIPLTWDPVPVPRPTYTMKARAERPEVADAEVSPEAGPVPRPADEDLDDRRVAGA